MQEGKGCMAGIKEKLAYCITGNVITCIVYIYICLFSLFPAFIFFYSLHPHNLIILLFFTQQVYKKMFSFCFDIKVCVCIDVIE